MKTFSIKQLFNQAWEDYKSNWKLFILVGIIFALVSLVSQLGTSIDPQTGMVYQSPLIGIAGWLLQMFVSLGFIKFLLSMIDGKEFKIEDLFNGASSIKHFVSFIVVGLLYGALVGFGTVLFIIPGIMAAIGLLFAQYIAAEEKSGIFESLKESWSMTNGHKWKILLLILAIGVFNLLGLLAFVIGLVITIPMTHIIYARLYRTLSAGRVTSDEDDMQVVDVLEGDQTESEE